jgi:predicted membrane protein
MFEFTAQSSGAYTFHFGNTFSWFTSKTVNLTYDVGLPTVGGIDFELLLIIIGVVAMLLIVIVILAVVFYRRKTKSKVGQTPPPPTNP